MLRRLTRFKILASSLCVVFAGAFSAQAQEAPDLREEGLAKQLSNPIAALIISYSANVAQELGPKSLNAAAKRTVKEIAKVLQDAFRKRG